MLTVKGGCCMTPRHCGTAEVHALLKFTLENPTEVLCVPQLLARAPQIFLRDSLIHILIDVFTEGKDVGERDDQHLTEQLRKKLGDHLELIRDHDGLVVRNKNDQVTLVKKD